LAAAAEDRRIRAGGDCNFIVTHRNRCLAGCKHLFSNDFIFTLRVKPYDLFFDIRPTHGILAWCLNFHA
jgi:hypothetical protein